jgi:hypothetical protein
VRRCSEDPLVDRAAAVAWPYAPECRPAKQCPRQLEKRALPQRRQPEFTTSDPRRRRPSLNSAGFDRHARRLVNGALGGHRPADVPAQLNRFARTRRTPKYAPPPWHRESAANPLSPAVSIARNCSPALAGLVAGKRPQGDVVRPGTRQLDAPPRGGFVTYATCCPGLCSKEGERSGRTARATEALPPVSWFRIRRRRQRE